MFNRRATHVGWSKHRTNSRLKYPEASPLNSINETFLKKSICIYGQRHKSHHKKCERLLHLQQASSPLLLLLVRFYDVDDLISITQNASALWEGNLHRIVYRTNEVKSAACFYRFWSTDRECKWTALPCQGHCSVKGNMLPFLPDLSM